MAGDFNDKLVRARNAPRNLEAVHLWRDLLTAVNVEETEYERVCAGLVDVYVQPGIQRLAAAAAIHEYQRDWDAAANLYSKVASTRDLARLHALRGNHVEAMHAYVKAGMPAHAASSAEQAQAWQDARNLWSQLIRPADSQQNLYVGALARFNAGRAAQKLDDTAAATSLFFEAVDRLGQEADVRETAGDRDGALRCFMVLVAVGRASGAFEDISEGYLNCARLLRLKGDRFGTIQALQELIRSAQEQGELHAAAELYREAGEYARRMGFIYADHFLVNAGHAWKRVASEGLERNRPISLVENALLAAVDSYGRTLDQGEVLRCYQALAALELSGPKKERYARLAQDLSALGNGAPNREESSASLPEYFKRRFGGNEYPVKDLLEREASVDVHVAASRLLADPGVWDVERRRALNLYLAFDDHRNQHGPDAAPPPALMHMVGECRHPTLVAPLVDAFKRGGVEVQCAAVLAASRMKLKEGCGLVDAALSRERGGEVYRAGVQAMRALTFPQALDSLCRIFANHDAQEVKEMALRNLAIIGTAEAAEFLLDVVRTNTAGLGARARQALMDNATDKMVSVFDNHKRSEPDPALRQFIASLGAKVRARREVIPV